jgi:hypothetical protein
MAKACIDKAKWQSELVLALEQNRSAPREAQQFMFQDAMRRGRGFVPGNKHEPEAFSQFVLVPAHNIP